MRVLFEQVDRPGTVLFRYLNSANAAIANDRSSNLYLLSFTQMETASLAPQVLRHTFNKRIKWSKVARWVE